MLLLYNFLPLYCPSYGTPTRLNRVDNPLAGKFKAKLAVSSAICGVMYSLVKLRIMMGLLDGSTVPLCSFAARQSFNP